jgi:GcrA cell cycle regulator
MSDIIARIQTLRQDRLSLAQIAVTLSRECGRPITRNSVAGAVHRAGLPKLLPRPPKPKRPRKRGFPPKRLAALSIGRTKPISPISAAARFALTLADQTIPTEQRRTLLELTETTCRWPVGDPRGAAFFFCGAKPVAGKPYCRCHQGRAWGGLP